MVKKVLNRIQNVFMDTVTLSLRPFHFVRVSTNPGSLVTEGVSQCWGRLEGGAKRGAAFHGG